MARGDVLLIPAEVAPKNHQASLKFKCIGAYPFLIEYNIMEKRKNICKQKKTLLVHRYLSQIQYMVEKGRFPIIGKLRLTLIKELMYGSTEEDLQKSSPES